MSCCIVSMFPIVVMYGIGFIFYEHVHFTQTADAQGQEIAQNSATTGKAILLTDGNNINDSNAIKLNVKEENGVYTLFNDEGINPTLRFIVNANNTVVIQNPTEKMHKIIIVSNGTELATSGDIRAASQGQLSFKPNMTGTFPYHCEYHPDTMKGVAEVTNK